MGSIASIVRTLDGFALVSNHNSYPDYPSDIIVLEENNAALIFHGDTIAGLKAYSEYKEQISAADDINSILLGFKDYLLRYHQNEQIAVIGCGLVKDNAIVKGIAFYNNYNISAFLHQVTVDKDSVFDFFQETINGIKGTKEEAFLFFSIWVTKVLSMQLNKHHSINFAYIKLNEAKILDENETSAILEKGAIYHNKIKLKCTTLFAEV